MKFRSSKLEYLIESEEIGCNFDEIMRTKFDEITEKPNEEVK